MIGKRHLIVCLAIAILLITVGVIILVINCAKKDEPASTPPGGTLTTYIDSPGIGKIAVRLELPKEPRYLEGVPVIVSISTFFTPLTRFHKGLDTTEIGAIYVAYLWPGNEDPATGYRSDGEYDHGGTICLAALRDVIRFASGLIPNIDGYYIDELLEITPLTDNVGLYAFSHPRIVATNVLAHHGKDLPNVKYLVGRENPTIDPMYSLELGYFDDERHPFFNPYYHPEDYTPKTINIDYSNLGCLLAKKGGYRCAFLTYSGHYRVVAGLTRRQ